MSDHAPHQKQEAKHVDGDARRRDHGLRATRDIADNLALQSLHASGAIRAKLLVGSAGDPAEAEADRMAMSALQGGSGCTCAPGRPACASCRQNATVRRKTRGATAAPATIGNLGLGAGRHLGDAERGFFESRMQADFSAVRLHDDAHAARANAQLEARAFTFGNDIAFARGEYQPHTSAGRELIAHELAHVVQGNSGTIRRQPADPAATKDKAASAADDPANPKVLSLHGTVDERIAAFKALVKTTAVHRLMANQRNLALWSLLIERSIPESDLAALGLDQSGGSRAYYELQDIRDPGLRELRAEQALGKFRACTGCHIENQLWGSKRQRESESLTAWTSPKEMRWNAQSGNGFGGAQQGGADFSLKYVPSTYKPPPDSTEGKLNRLLPDPTATRAQLARIQPIVQALGPQGYKVLPGSMLTSLIEGKPGAVRAEINSAIDQRDKDFGELIKKINAGEVDWEHFGPIISSLLPIADSQVRTAIQKEMDDHAFWNKVEAVVVGILTVAALIALIFPPTTALGIAAIAALDIGLGAYGLSKGEEMMRVGTIYGLGTGAHDVFSPEQQAAADSMVFMGFISMVGGMLQGVGGIARLDAAVARMGAGGRTALATAAASKIARVIQQGDYIITIAEDGSMYITIASRPDLVIMARGNTATLYQVMEGGGLRAIQTATLPGKVATPAAASLLLSAGGEAGAASTAMVPAGQAATAGAAAESPLLLGPGAAGPGRVLITPPPRVPWLLGPGNPTTYSWDQISRMRQPNLWQERETYMQQLYGAPGQQHFPVPGAGGRYVDVPVQLPSGQLFAGEVKSYTRWITAEGQAQRNAVELTERIQEQIAKDVSLRGTQPGYDPRWIFTDAPPSDALRQALRNANITFIVHN
jgi:hypothetical protein